MDKDFLMVIFLPFLFQHAFEHAFFLKICWFCSNFGLQIQI